MKKHDIELIKESIIKKWLPIYNGAGSDDGPENCYLCMEYFKKLSLNTTCKGCPVFKSTFKRCCTATPYYEWRIYVNHKFNFSCFDYLEKNPFWILSDPKARSLAWDEIKFLNSLLPEQGRLKFESYVEYI
jgi:hypothetical protein